MTQTTFEKYWLLVDPWYFLLLSASYIPLTIFHLITNLQLSTFFSPSLFKDAWFATFWSVVGPETRKNAAVRVTPLLSLASGTVLDIGPGSGEWVSVFDKSKITKIYGVEPNRDHHPALRKKIKEAGLEGRYEIVPVGVEDLGVKWVGLGSVDTVVTVQCLCSVDEPRKMMGELYGYLKEGGSWIVYEHVVVYPHQGFFMKKYQAAIDILWPHFLGGCSITRDTGKWLKDCGSWSKVDLKQPEDEVPMGFHCVPHVIGTLTK